MSEPGFPHHVTVRIWGFVRPVSRGERYEDPVQAALAAQQLGIVDGGGSQLGEADEIVFAELELYLADLDQALELTKRVLEQAGAPVGSELRFQRDGAAVVVPFGTQECVAIYLDGTTLPDEVYALSDGDALIDRINQTLGSEGQVRASWDGPRDTALYVYGANAEDLYTRLEPVLLQDPQCQNARVVIRYGNPSLNQRTLRLPRTRDGAA